MLKIVTSVFWYENFNGYKFSLQPLVQPLNPQKQQLGNQKKILLLVHVDQVASQLVNCGVSLEHALHLFSLLASLSLSAVFAEKSRKVVLRVSKVLFVSSLHFG